MRKALLSLPLLLSTSLFAQTPAIQWQKTIGGSGMDGTGSGIQTLDGGYILAGQTSSTDYHGQGNHGMTDGLVVKLSAAGAVAWQKCYGGSQLDYISTIRQLADSGYIVTGTTFSADGDMTANHGHNDCWVARLDASGGIIWQRSYGGSSHDGGIDVIPTADNGFVMTGFTQSNDGDVSGIHGVNADYWVVRLDSAGAIQWQQCLGGTDQDMPRSIVQAADGGYVVSGYSGSTNGDVTGNHGGWDIWVVKLSPSGAIRWQQCLGGTSYESMGYLTGTTDGGFAIAGFTSSQDFDVNYQGSVPNGMIDAWLVKLDSNGNKQWQRPIGGNKVDVLSAIHQTPDGGYIAAGRTSSTTGGGISGLHGGEDWWLVQLNSAGTVLWQGLYGGSDTEGVASVIPTNDSGYFAVGNTRSANGDVSGKLGSFDGWAVKLKAAPAAVPHVAGSSPVTLFPNPASQWIRVSHARPGSQLRILDAVGREVMVSCLGPSGVADIAPLAPGLYQVVVTGEDGGWVTRPLVKQ